MNVRFFRDEDGGPAHCFARHGVSETEVVEALADFVEDRPGRDDSRVLIGRSNAGRWLKIVYVPDPDHDGVFVVTAYDLTGKPLQALRRRRRNRR